MTDLTIAPAPNQPIPATPPGLGDGELSGHRALALVAAIALFLPAEVAISAIAHSPLVGLLGATCTGVVLVLICAISGATSLSQLERLDWWLLGTAVSILILAVSAISSGATSYVTDEAALVHGAAATLLNGHDPYGANLGWSLTRYGVSTDAYRTYLMNGGVVHQLGYPALPVLAALPLVALNGHASAVTILDGTSLCVAATLMFLLLPRRARPLAVITCAGVPALLTLATDGLSSMMLLATLSVSAYHWARVGELRTDGRGSLRRGNVAQAACLGLAIATNQLAWFVAPFLIVGIHLGARQRLGPAPARRIGAHYLAVALLVFLLINGPFILWDPHTWLSGVLLPLTQQAIPYGQGLVGLTAIAGLGGGALRFYTIGAALLYAGLLALYWLRFAVLSRCVMLLPLIALYTGARSLAPYWLVMIGVVILSVVCHGGSERAAEPQRSDPGHRPPPRHTVRQVALLAPAAAAFALALGSPAPLNLRIIGGHSGGSRKSMNEVSVLVSNTSNQVLRPHFGVNFSGMIAGFWRARRGPAWLRPGASAVYVLLAPSLDAQPSAGSTFVVQAVTAGPQTISSSARAAAPRVR